MEEYPGKYLEEQEEEQLEEQAEKQKDIYENIEDTSPEPQEKYDLYSLFWRVVLAKDSSKVGNVTKEELGSLLITIRDNQRIALLAKVLGHKQFGKFFKKQGEITLSTSASKDGWLPELFVSQKKFTTKKKGGNIENLMGQPQPKKKWGLFGRR